MLDKVPGKVLRKLYIRERCLARIFQDCRESDRRSAGSRMQCSKPQLEKTTVHESCFTCVITHFSKIITCLFAFWWIVALGMLWRILAKCSNIPLWSMWLKCRDYALWRILAKCCDLRTLPGENFELPGTFNYFEPLIRVSTFAFEMHHHFVFLWTQFKLLKFYIWIIECVICFIWFHSYRVDLNCDIWHGFGVNNISHNTGFIQREKV